MNKRKKKIVILAMSCEQDFFRQEEEVIRNTWGKDIIAGKYSNIRYFSYTADPKRQDVKIDRERHRITVHSDDSLFGTYEKTYQVFDVIRRMFSDYDYIFRTNTSTYVNVPLLDELVQSLSEDDDMVYCGTCLSPEFVISPFSRCCYAQGNCMLLNRHYVEMITRENYGLLIDNDMVTRPSSHIAPIRLIDDNVIGGIINTQLILQGKNHIDYYQDFSLTDFEKCNPYEYHKQLAVIMKNPDREKKEFENYYKLHGIMTEYYRNHEPDMSFIEERMKQGLIITRSVDQTRNELTYTKEDYIRQLKKEKSEIPYLD